MAKNQSTQNNFIRGLITEATGLNFPENACTDTSNCVFSLIGDVTTRLGIDFEDNNVPVVVPNNTNVAVSTFRWLNAGGDGQTEILVLQVGAVLYFFESSAATVDQPLSTTLLSTSVTMTQFAAGSEGPSSIECNYAIGNGYLFVYHPLLNTFYCTFSDGQVQATSIDLQIRDYLGVYPEPGNLGVQVRPLTLTPEHNYNLQNQGWTGVPAWTATYNNTGLDYTYFNQPNAFQIQLTPGNQTFSVASGLAITIGQSVSLNWQILNQATFNTITASHSVETFNGVATGTVLAYSGTVLLVDVTSSPIEGPGSVIELLSNVGNPTKTIVIAPGLVDNAINTFFSDEGVYPADCDIWYTFKDSTNIFNPTATYSSVLTTNSVAPQGHFILDAFNLDRSAVSGVKGITPITTTARPSTGTFFQGRVWYAGLNAAQPASGDVQFYTWTENLYFSQVLQQGDITSFGACYKSNDPTDETFFADLPTDGGVITIQGCGNIYKLFPIQNGLLVFARNGVWFITGSQGIGFSATDYTITKISSVQSISNASFVDVLGLPMFWNEEGIYRVIPDKSQGLTVEPMTVGTILSFYNQIPLDSKLYVHGDYNPITYIVQWTYRSTQEQGLIDRYSYDSVLNFNIYNKAFYPYSVSSGMNSPTIQSVFFLNYTNSLTAPEPGFKYVTFTSNNYTFSEEHDDVNFVDWFSFNNAGYPYDSFFVTGYNLHGKALQKWQPVYVYMYSRNDEPFGYVIQGIWDYALSGNSGRYSTPETVINGLGQPNFGNVIRRHKIRGHGQSLQIKVSNVQGYPFDIMGWTILNDVDTGV